MLTNIVWVLFNQAFTPSQVNILEYNEDLKYFYKSGYGRSLNKRLSCTAVTDMLKHLESKEQPKVISYFAHEATILLLLTALGANKDQYDLRADNFQQMQRRKFRSSELSPFAANLAVIKYDCPNDNERTKVMFFLNQKPLDFAECNVGLCDWSKMKQIYSQFMKGDCETSYCQSSGATRLMTIGWTMGLALIFVKCVQRLL